MLVTILRVGGNKPVKYTRAAPSHTAWRLEFPLALVPTSYSEAPDMASPGASPRGLFFLETAPILELQWLEEG